MQTISNELNPKTKLCSKCKQEKPVELFHKNPALKSGLRSNCKECIKRYLQTNADLIKKKKKIYCNNNKDKIRDYYKKNAKKIREHYLKKTYSISFEQLRQMFLSQEGRCAICSKVFNKRKDVHVDHNHNTGEVRGLLCSSCNRGIGYLRDDSSILLKAASYLNKFNKLCDLIKKN